MTFIADVDRLTQPDPTGEVLSRFLAGGEIPAVGRVLLVDDNKVLLMSLAMVLERGGFDVVTASSVNDALKEIATQTFDVLLSDLHMPGAGDGLTVVSAMRHANPRAVTMIFSGFPEMKEAAAAILLQADEILIKPMRPAALLAAIKDRLNAGSNAAARATQTVSSILAHNIQATIDDWLHRVEQVPDVIAVRLSTVDRCAHLPHLFRDLLVRLRTPLALGTRALAWSAASVHGKTRHQQGYTAAMIVEESRMLQVSIFNTLQNNLHQIDFSLLLQDVMVIADEVDSQLAQAMSSYTEAAQVDILPPSA